MKLVLIALALLLAGTVSALDPRVSYAIPMLPASEGLITNDPFYNGQQVESSYQLPAIFGGPEPTMTPEPEWMNLTGHMTKMSAENKTITAGSSYDLTEGQMAAIPLGQESWL